MRLKSRGLGRKELVLDFREYQVVREDGEILVRGTIHEPVHWDFTIRVCEDDLPGLARVALRRSMIGFLLRAAFRRKKRAHWTQDVAAHRAEVEARRRAAAEAGA